MTTQLWNQDRAKTHLHLWDYDIIRIISDSHIILLIYKRVLTWFHGILFSERADSRIRVHLAALLLCCGRTTQAHFGGLCRIVSLAWVVLGERGMGRS